MGRHASDYEISTVAIALVAFCSCKGVLLFALITVADSARKKRYGKWLKRWHPLSYIDFFGGPVHAQASVGSDDP